MKKMKKGFTIVELVIVIGVIAILSAVLIPTFANLSSKAKEATAQQEVADVYTAYVIDAAADAKGQAEVIIAHTNGEQYVYTAGSGWAKESPKTSLTGKTILFDNGDNDKVADDGEIVVYAK